MSALNIPGLDLDFRSIELEHRAELSAFLETRPHSLSGFTFAPLYVYRESFLYGWTFAGPETLLISCILDPDRGRHLLQPVGSVDPGLGERIVAAARAASHAFSIVGVERAFLDQNPDFARRWEVIEEPENANYIYRATDLAQLAGRAYAKKRNLIAQAAKLYQWTVEPLTDGNAGAAEDVVRVIQAEEPWEESLVLQQEVDALVTTLRNLDVLQQEGVLVRVEGAPAGFVVFEAQSADTAVIHFERALRRYKGLHQVVNQAAAQAILARGFAFINREEDLGNPGLRRAKQSYHPLRLAEALRLVLKP